MASAPANRADWHDGFLFIANQPSLDFLNTHLVSDGQPVEFLPDVQSVVRWLVAAGLLLPKRAGEISRRWECRAGVLAFLEQLRAFREQLRRVVLRRESGRPPEPSFLQELNRLLAQHPMISEVEMAEGHLRRRMRFDPQIPEDSFGPLADAAASLLSEIDPNRIRQCESCVAHFYDTSKKGSRRWCSMQICGNKYKVAAYGQRQRARNAKGATKR